MAQRNDKQAYSSQGKQNPSQKSKPETPLSEKIVGGIGLLLVLATIGYLLYQGFQAQGPPEVVIEATDITPQETGYLVEITVTNRGGQTAEGLVVMGDLMPKPPTGSQDGQRSQPVESAQVSFSFVPPRSHRQGGLVFSHNPLDYDLELHADGYTKP